LWAELWVGNIRFRSARAETAIVGSPQLGVFRLGLPQDRNVGVGVLPERQEILIRGVGLGARGFGV